MDTPTNIIEPKKHQESRPDVHFYQLSFANAPAFIPAIRPVTSAEVILYPPV